MTNAIYLLGGPGTGKSSVMERLLKGWEIGPCERLTEREMMGHYLDHDLLGRGIYLGRMREQFPGTDALCMSVSPHAFQWLDTADLSQLTMIYGEGGRLGTPGFLISLRERARLTAVLLTAEPEVARERRESRPDTGDWVDRKKPTQSLVWAKGQVTRAEAASWSADRRIVIDTTDKTVDDVMEELWKRLT